MHKLVIKKTTILVKSYTFLFKDILPYSLRSSQRSTVNFHLLLSILSSSIFETNTSCQFETELFTFISWTISLVSLFRSLSLLKRKKLNDCNMSSDNLPISSDEFIFSKFRREIFTNRYSILLTIPSIVFTTTQFKMFEKIKWKWKTVLQISADSKTV